MHYAHNDYLRIGFELGWVGLIGFVLAATWQMFGLGLRIKRSDGVLRKAYAASWLGFCGLLITSTTDDTLIYNAFYTDPLFVVLGAAYGVSIAESPRESAVETLQPRTGRLDVALRKRKTSYTA
jgi:O-antigen ligase